MEVLHSALGTVFYTVVVFVAGALIGTPSGTGLRPNFRGVTKR